MKNWSAELKTNGWADIQCQQNKSLRFFLTDIAKELGVFVLGRRGVVVEKLQPMSSEKAYPSSLSKQYGFRAFPLHNDTAHLPTPCRYIILGCEEAGQVLSPTVLLDTRNLNVTEDEMSYINSASFFVKNGSKSFYAAIKPKDKPFFRFDPGCMQPVSIDGEQAVGALRIDRHANSLIEILWKKNKVIIIDNWRMLHGRNNMQVADFRRSLLRVMIK